MTSGGGEIQMGDTVVHPEADIASCKTQAKRKILTPAVVRQSFEVL